MDRSGHDVQIGATAVLYRGGVEKKPLRKHMGSKEHHTVFEAEILGISLATEMIKAERHVQTATIGAESQAAIHAIMHGRGTPGQYPADAFHEQLATIQHKHPGIEIKLRWIPGHKRIMGMSRWTRRPNRCPRANPVASKNYPNSASRTYCTTNQQCASLTGKNSAPKQKTGLSNCPDANNSNGSKPPCPP